MTQEQARAAAGPVFEAVGLSVEQATTTITPYGASVRLDPVVHGLRTSGYTTQVDLSAERKVQWASGYLGAPEQGDSYPLVTAKAAFDAIPVPPVMEMLCPVTKDGKGCAPLPAPEITGAELGLVLRQTTKGEQLLVPAWLFAVKGWDQPLGQIAIDEKYLGTPETPTPQPGQTDGGTTPEPAPAPGSVEPAPPAKPTP
jgi:hypothetical protein